MIRDECTHMTQMQTIECDFGELRFFYSALRNPHSAL
jgi:hypothetical protein